MIEFYTAKNEPIIVDDEDYKYIKSFGTWYFGKYYPQIILKNCNPNKTLLLHRTIWERHFGNIPKNLMIDHKDNNPSNNQKSNFRLVTKLQNRTNSREASHNLTKIKGCHFDKRSGRFQSMIRFNKKLYHIGMFDSTNKAGYAYSIISNIINKEYSRSSDIVIGENDKKEVCLQISKNKKLFDILNIKIINI